MAKKAYQTPHAGKNLLKNFFNHNNVGNWIKSNPLPTAGLGILGAGNIAGLFDNPNVGGQLLGAGLGTAGALGIPKLLGKAALPAPLSAAIGMGGGALGALFDSAVAKQEAQQKEQQELEKLKYMAMLQNQK